MGVGRRLLALFLGMFFGYCFSLFINDLIKKHGVYIRPEFSQYDFFTALVSGNFNDWVLWLFYTHPMEVTMFLTVIGGLIAVALVD